MALGLELESGEDLIGFSQSLQRPTLLLFSKPQNSYLVSSMPYSAASHLILPMLLYVNLTQARLILEEKTSIEKCTY